MKDDGQVVKDSGSAGKDSVRFYDCITDFIFLEDKPRRADVIFVPGGNYPDSARKAAALYREGYAPYVLPSGRFGKLKGCFEPEQEADSPKICYETEQGADSPKVCYETEQEADSPKVCYETEWEYLRDILIKEGVPPEAILREDRATFTWENAIYSRKVLEREGIRADSAIIVCQAFHARRCYLYYREQFPKTQLLVCPVVTKGISRENWFLDERKIDVVLGEVERCGSQFHRIMKSKIGHDEPAEDSFPMDDY